MTAVTKRIAIDHDSQERRFRTLASMMMSEADTLLNIARGHLEVWLLARENAMDEFGKFTRRMNEYKRVYHRAQNMLAKAEHHARKQALRPE